MLACSCESELASRDGSKCFHDKVTLALPYPSLQRLHAVLGLDWDPNLPNDATGVVVVVHEVDGHARFGLARRQYRFEHVVAEHALPAEFWQERGGSVEDAPAERR